MTENKPNIRFKGFEEEWEDKPFADEADTRRGLTYSPSSICQKGIRVLRSSNISDDSFVKSDDDVFVEESAINIDYAKNNDILITAANGSQRLVGKHCLISGIEEKSTVHGGFMLLASAKNPHFLNASMGSSWYRDFINFFVAGGNGAIGNLNKADLDSYIIRVPSETEQRKIGEFFKQLDELIGAKEQELEKLRQIKLALLDKMFPSDNQENINRGGKSLIYKVLQNSSQLVVSSPAPNTPTIRFRGFTEPWGKKRIEEIVRCPLDYGLNAASTKYDGKRKYLRITDIDDSMRTFNYSDLTSPNLNNISDNYKLQNGDIVFARTGASVGKTYLYDKCDGEVYFAGFLIRARIKDMYSPYFVFTSTLTDDFSKFIKITSQRTGQPGVNAQEYESYSLYIPGSYDEQRKIGDFFRSQDEAIANSQLQINKLKTIKQACLSQMFA